MSERFNNVEPFLDSDGDVALEIERNERQYPTKVGLLWAGGTWLTVAEARALRAWLDRVIPDETPSSSIYTRDEPLDPRRGEERIADNE